MAQPLFPELNKLLKIQLRPFIHVHLHIYICVVLCGGCFTEPGSYMLIHNFFLLMYHGVPPDQSMGTSLIMFIKYSTG